MNISTADPINKQAINLVIDYNFVKQSNAKCAQIFFPSKMCIVHDVKSKALPKAGHIKRHTKKQDKFVTKIE